MASSKVHSALSSQPAHTNENSTTASALPIKAPHSSHGHRSQHTSHSLGTTNSNHRITRRKSMSSSGVSQAAAIAAIKEVEASASPVPVTSSLSFSKQVPPTTTAGFMVEGQPATAMNGLPSPPSSLPGNGGQSTLSALSSGFKKSGFASNLVSGIGHEETIEEEETADLNMLGLPMPGRAKSRRASEGAFGSVESHGHSKNDLKCEKCGKGYKHSSCLTKHLWEHTPEWTYTSKLLISKHQQVQLLEAASILVSMKPDSPPQSAGSSSSPPTLNDSSNESSSDTTPPPPSSTQPTMSARTKSASQSGVQASRRFSSNSRQSSGPYSRSYQPPPSGQFFTGKSAPTSAANGFKNPYGTPPSAAARLESPTPGNKHDDDSLAAAVELLSCSFGGTPVLGPTKVDLSSKVPTQSLSSSIKSPFKLPSVAENQSADPNTTPTNFIKQMRDAALRDADNDVDMDGDGSSHRYRNSEALVEDDEEDEDDDKSSRHKDHDEDGVFGKMEE